MVPSNRDDAALLDRAVHVHEVVNGAAADIDDQHAEILLVLADDNLRARQGIEHHVFHFQGDLLDATDRVLHPRADAVDDVIIRFQLRAQHADRRQHAILAVDVIMLDDGVQKRVLRGDVHITCVALDLLQIVLVDFVAILRQLDHATIVETR